jgi:hypothetical protein
MAHFPDPQEKSRLAHACVRGIETVGDREILVDQEGLAVTNILNGRLTDPVATPERMGKTPTLVVQNEDAVAGAMSLDEYLTALRLRRGMSRAGHQRPLRCVSASATTVFGGG